MNPMKKMLPGSDKPPRPREADVQTIAPLPGGKKKPRQVRDFEEKTR